MGTITYGPAGTVLSLSGANGSLQLTAAALSRTGQGTLEILFNKTTVEPASAGTYSFTSGTSGEKMIVTSAPTVTNAMVDPSIIGVTNDANKSLDFLNYNSTNGFLVTTFTSVTSDTNFVSTTNYKITGSYSQTTSGRTGNSFNVASGITWRIGTNANTTVTDGSGGLILNSGAFINGASSNNTTGTLAFGAVEARVGVNGTGTLYDNSTNTGRHLALTGSVGMTKFGSGTLVIGGGVGNVTLAGLTGTYTVNNGSVRLRGETLSAFMYRTIVIISTGRAIKKAV